MTARAAVRHHAGARTHARRARGALAVLAARRLAVGLPLACGSLSIHARLHLRGLAVRALRARAALSAAPLVRRTAVAARIRIMA
jgi:hypothetical protein